MEDDKEEGKRKQKSHESTRKFCCFLFKCLKHSRGRASKAANTKFPIPQIPSINLSTTMALIPSIFSGRRSNIFDPISLDIWDPFEGFNHPSSASSAFANTRFDWKETPQAHIFKADLPGIKKEELKVEVEVEEGRVLQISGERSREQEEKNDKWHRIERSSGKFTRRFRLPENAQVGEVKANMENGVLTVTVPKMEEKKPEVKSIHISG